MSGNLCSTTNLIRVIYVCKGILSCFIFYLQTVFLSLKDITVGSTVLSRLAKLQTLVHVWLAITFPVGTVYVKFISRLVWQSGFIAMLYPVC